MMLNVPIPIRKGTAEAWQSINPILGDGEPGVEKDTNKIKIGNGILPWNDLPYYIGKFELSRNKKTITFIEDGVKFQEDNGNKIEQVTIADIADLPQEIVLLTPSTADLATTLKSKKRKRKKG